MCNFKDIYALDGPGYSQWSQAKTEKELRIHLFEVGFRLECVLQNKGKDAAKKQEHREELAKESADLLILLKHYVLNYGSGTDMLDERHPKF